MCVVRSPAQNWLNKVHLENIRRVWIVLDTDPKGQEGEVRVCGEVVGWRGGHNHGVGSLGDVLTVAGRAKVEHVAKFVAGVDIRCNEACHRQEQG